jgi:hypothetical protein
VYGERHVSRISHFNLHNSCHTRHQQQASACANLVPLVQYGAFQVFGSFALCQVGSSGSGYTVNKRASAVRSYPVSQARNCAQASVSLRVSETRAFHARPWQVKLQDGHALYYRITPGRSLYYLREVTTRHNTKSGPMQVRASHISTEDKSTCQTPETAHP